MTRPRLPIPALLVCFGLLATPVGAAATIGPATPPDPASGAAPTGVAAWRDRLDRIVEGHPVSVVVGADGVAWYRHRPGVLRTPASNQKLLLTMALFARLGPARTIPTRAMAAAVPADGIVRGPLFLVGRGDPEVGRADLRELAAALAADGVTRVRGRVLGATTPFARDWFAQGWKSYFPAVYVARPTALTIDGNRGRGGGHLADPELRAAAVFTRVLRRAGVAVSGDPGARALPSGLLTLAAARSDPLLDVVRRMNHVSSNFRAEVLGKLLGFERFELGSIRGTSRAIRAFAAARGERVDAYDASGLSYDNRVTAAALVRMLWWAEDRPWADDMMGTLPSGGEGTLGGRLEDVTVLAKTGTLVRVSALSGWVWIEQDARWAAFSILSSGMDTGAAKRLEDRIVGAIARRATTPP